MLVSQLSLRSLSSETWAAIVAAIGSALLIAKKLINRRRKAKAEVVTRAEFHHSMDAMRNRVGAGHRALAEKIDANHRELLQAIARQGETFEQRIDRLEVNLARVDERTINSL